MQDQASMQPQSHLDAPVINEHIVHFEEGVLGRPVGVKANEGVAQRVPRLGVANDVTRGDLAKAREDDLEVLCRLHNVWSANDGWTERQPAAMSEPGCSRLMPLSAVCMTALSTSALAFDAADSDARDTRPANTRRSPWLKSVRQRLLQPLQW